MANYVRDEYEFAKEADEHEKFKAALAKQTKANKDLEHKIQYEQEPEQIRPNHYGGPENPYEAIKVIDAWGAGFNLGNAIKYIARVCISLIYEGQSRGYPKMIEDLKKARTYLDFEIKKLEGIK